MGIPLDDSANYEKSLTDFGNFVQARVFAPLLFDDRMYRWLGYARKCNRLIKPMHEFARDVIKRRRAILDSRGWPQQNTTNNDDSVQVFVPVCIEAHFKLIQLQIFEEKPVLPFGRSSHSPTRQRGH